MAKLELYDSRMLEVIDYMKYEKGINKGVFLASIGFDHANLRKVINGSMSFKIFHFSNCINLYKINPGYFFNQTEKMFKKS